MSFPPFDDPVYVTRPLLPPLPEVMARLTDVWAAQWLTNAGAQHERLARLAHHIDLSVGGNRRREEDAVEPVTPDALSGTGIGAGDHADLVGHVQKSVVVDDGRHVGRARGRDPRRPPSW